MSQLTLVWQVSPLKSRVQSMKRQKFFAFTGLGVKHHNSHLVLSSSAQLGAVGGVGGHAIPPAPNTSVFWEHRALAGLCCNPHQFLFIHCKSSRLNVSRGTRAPSKGLSADADSWWQLCLQIIAQHLSWQHFLGKN